MNFDFRLIRKLSGIICLVVGAAMIPCVFIALGCAEYAEMRIFLLLLLAFAAAGCALFVPVRRATHQIKM
ncbi:MAG: hypothetical protein LBL54_05220, partial [Clostridiales Family XIII bacterium]|nr:hypothetical protein [Clostridiales Family XIII bacterium]